MRADPWSVDPQVLLHPERAQRKWMPVSRFARASERTVVRAIWSVDPQVLLDHREHFLDRGEFDGDAVGEMPDYAGPHAAE